MAQSDSGTMDANTFVQSLQYQTGTVGLLSQKVQIQVPSHLRFLDASNAQRLLEEGWGNPEDSSVLGMLVPASVSPLSDQSWGVVITYQDDGHISDQDASSINYSKLLREMQDSTRSSNDARQEQGYPTVNLVGWATPPRYEATTHKMYWAKELAFGDMDTHILNYDVRVLGRTGVLNLSAVAGMEQLAAIEQAIPSVLSSVAFTPGNRYEDFQAGRDKLAEYGLTALVAGGLGAAASKTGLLATLLLVFKKFFVFIIAGVLGLLRLIGGRKQNA